MGAYLVANHGNAGIYQLRQRCDVEICGANARDLALCLQFGQYKRCVYHARNAVVPPIKRRFL